MTISQSMGRKPRKMEELAGRTDVMLEKANELMEKHGYQGFTMADVAREIDFAKGTLYLHFQSKEDMTAAISAKNLERRADLLEAAFSYQGSSRERFMALILAEEQFYQEAPNHFAWDAMLRQASFWDKVSDQRKEAHSNATKRCLSCVEEVIRQAIKDGDLAIESGRIRQVVMMFVSFARGYVLSSSAIELRTYAGMGEEDVSLLEDGFQTVLDGLGWKPLKADFAWKRKRPVLLRRLKTRFPKTTK